MLAEWIRLVIGYCFEWSGISRNTYPPLSRIRVYTAYIYGPPRTGVEPVFFLFVLCYKKVPQTVEKYYFYWKLMYPYAFFVSLLYTDDCRVMNHFWFLIAIMSINSFRRSRIFALRKFNLIRCFLRVWRFWWYFLNTR